MQMISISFESFWIPGRLFYIKICRKILNFKIQNESSFSAASCKGIESMQQNRIV